MNLAARIAVSLLRDLVIPWIISAVCILVFLAIVAKFSLLAWPFCFLVFLWICNVRDTMRKEDAAAAERERSRQASATTDAHD